MTEPETEFAALAAQASTLTVHASTLMAEVLRRPARLGRTRLVCVDGPSAAGKTMLAGRLATAFHPAAPVVHTDDLLDGWDDQFTFWPRLEERVLAPLRAGYPARYRPYDWVARSFGDVEIEVPPAPVVLVEGVSAARAVARTEATFTVFVTAPEPVRLARSLARDTTALAPYLERWRRREAAHFAADATAEHADLVVDTGTGTGVWRYRDPPGAAGPAAPQTGSDTP